jgi:Galactose mutarotase and related enzymes
LEYTLSNDDLTVKFRSFGGEMTSVRDRAGTEYLWQGDPAYWGGQAPVLFPIVGSLRNKTAIVGGNKTCHMERHGVARKKQFTLEGITEDSIAFSLSSDEETRQRFPYDFQLTIRYRLSGKTVTTEYTVRNPNGEALPFQIGGHPGFNCLLADGEHFEDYVVEFEQEETADCPQLEPDSGLLDRNRRIRMLDHQKAIRMDHNLFRTDALIFDQLKSRRAKLYNPQTGRGIRMDFTGLDYFLVWSSANGGPFVALEPWSGLSTATDESDIFEEKCGVRLLAPGAQETLSFDVTVLN